MIRLIPDSPQIGEPPNVLKRKQKYLNRYREKETPKIRGENLPKIGIQELAPRPEKPRKRPPHYLTISGSAQNAEAKEVVKPRGFDLEHGIIYNEPCFTNIQMGDPLVVLNQYKSKLPSRPKTRSMAKTLPRSHSRPKSTVESYRRYDPSKSISWKYFGEVDNQMGVLTEHIRVRRDPKIYAKTVNFSSRSPLTSTPRYK